MLIETDRHTSQDLALWREHEEADRVYYDTHDMPRKEQQALDEMLEFARKPCYAGVSWGKDSTVLAHLVYRLLERDGVDVPCVWVKVEPIGNPDCVLVEDAFTERYAVRYSRVVSRCSRDMFGWHATGTLESGFAEAVRQYGDRHLSGVRAEESGQRKLRMMSFGKTTLRTCAPIGWWTAADVFAYLAHYELPVHPAYGMLGGGRWRRERIRVASLGGRRGDGMGRAEWEAEYYGDQLRRLEAGW